jgi:hypothetical protein
MSYLETLIEKPAIIIDIGYAYTKCGKFKNKHIYGNKLHILIHLIN